MFKKKKKSEPTTADLRYSELWANVWSAPVISKAQDVIIKQGAVSLYPDGPDKDAALEAVEKAKYSLLCAIGHYDATLAELKHFWSEHFEELDECRTWVPYNRAESHALVESAYRDFFKT